MNTNYFLTLILFVAQTVTWAGSTSCSTHYFSGVAPEITNANVAVRTRELCFSAFGVMHSGVTKTPLWSAEHLTRETLIERKGLKRVDSFHEEDRLSPGDRAELRDYSRSGYDRGHLSPNGDMPNSTAMNDSFTLANIVPQNSNNNQNLWNDIETAVRTMVKREGDLYIITGALFSGRKAEVIGGRVWVPTHMYKIVFSPKQNRAAAYLSKNEATSEYRELSLLEIERLSGINFFPNMTIENKVPQLKLPTPSSHGRPKSEDRLSSHQAASHPNPDVSRTLANTIRYFFK